jgi:hypothetical protein
MEQEVRLYGWEIRLALEALTAERQREAGIALLDGLVDAVVAVVEGRYLSAVQGLPVVCTGCRRLLGRYPVAAAGSGLVEEGKVTWSPAYAPVMAARSPGAPLACPACEAPNLWIVVRAATDQRLLGVLGTKSLPITPQDEHTLTTVAATEASGGGEGPTRER